jgi:hypothetical protein
MAIGPWFCCNAAAVFPTFTFNYSGFSGQPAISQRRAPYMADRNHEPEHHIGYSNRELSEWGNKPHHP